jgi:hypothetical protein
VKPKVIYLKHFFWYGRILKIAGKSCVCVCHFSQKKIVSEVNGIKKIVIHFSGCFKHDIFDPKMLAKKKFNNWDFFGNYFQACHFLVVRVTFFVTLYEKTR